MEKVNGRFYGSCHECGHAIPVKVDGEPLVECIPKKDLMGKYAEGCKFLIPKCEHTQRTMGEVHKPKG